MNTIETIAYHNESKCEEGDCSCRVMAKRLRDVCALPESEPLWRAGRGFVVRDLPWTVEKLRVIPPFEFENWAVIALGGMEVAASRQSAAT